MVTLDVRLFEAAGTDEQMATRTEVEATLGYLGRDSSAIVRGIFISTSTGIGFIRVCLAVNLHGVAYYYDPRSGRLSRQPPWGDDPKVKISVGYLGADGKALLPVDRHNRERWGFHGIGMNAWLAELSEAQKSQLADNIEEMNADFASAMDGDVAPGSDEANALAEQHLALLQELVGDYDYGLHRYFGRRLVTEGSLRDPYEWIAPGLARYVSQVIVANADRHLGAPTAVSSIGLDGTGPGDDRGAGDPPRRGEGGGSGEGSGRDDFHRWEREFPALAGLEQASALREVVVGAIADPGRCCSAGLPMICRGVTGRM